MVSNGFNPNRHFCVECLEDSKSKVSTYHLTLCTILSIHACLAVHCTVYTVPCTTISITVFIEEIQIFSFMFVTESRVFPPPPAVSIYWQTPSQVVIWLYESLNFSDRKCSTLKFYQKKRGEMKRRILFPGSVYVQCTCRTILISNGIKTTHKQLKVNEPALLFLPLTSKKRVQFFFNIAIEWTVHTIFSRYRTSAAKRFVCIEENK